jgi:DivIVA domain-containing protein
MAFTDYKRFDWGYLPLFIRLTLAAARPLAWIVLRFSVMPESRTSRLTDLSKIEFRTALRGFDRDQVRAVLARVAGDYRVLQMQNESLRRQLSSLEETLRTYEQRTGMSRETSVAPDREIARTDAQPPASRERDANGIRIISHTFNNTLKKLDSALVEVPALPKY